MYKLNLARSCRHQNVYRYYYPANLGLAWNVVPEDVWVDGLWEVWWEITRSTSWYGRYGRATTTQTVSRQSAACETRQRGAAHWAASTCHGAACTMTAWVVGGRSGRRLRLSFTTTIRDGNLEYKCWEVKDKKCRECRTKVSGVLRAHWWWECWEHIDAMATTLRSELWCSTDRRYQAHNVQLSNYGGLGGPRPGDGRSRVLRCF